jgi:TRAP transporter TAXI family solute receptor
MKLGASRAILRAVIMAAALAVWGDGAMTAPAEDTLTLTLGTATPGGGFPVYGEAVAAAIAEADPSLRIETRNTKGSTENVPLLEAEKLDIALVQGEVAYEALSGIGRAPAPLPRYSQPSSRAPALRARRASPPRGAPRAR